MHLMYFFVFSFLFNLQFLSLSIRPISVLLFFPSTQKQASSSNSMSKVFFLFFILPLLLERYNIFTRTLPSWMTTTGLPLVLKCQSWSGEFGKSFFLFYLKSKQNHPIDLLHFRLGVRWMKVARKARKGQ